MRKSPDSPSGNRFARRKFASPVRLLVLPLLIVSAVLSVSCKTAPKDADVIVSVKDQKLGIYDTSGKLVHSYKISTSKFGLGDTPGSNCTPLGKHEIVAKIGHGLPKGAVLKSRHWNGEVLPPNAPGRDPIVSRILWLKGLENTNKNAFNRFIYIHGTPEEKNLGKPASYGCIRMGMSDVINLFEDLGIGTTVEITPKRLPRS
jgi:lipoprotein-anchoring transpeptidase ErfK/SrfK